MNSLSHSYLYPEIDTEIEDIEIELRIEQLTSKGGPYYPFTRDRIVEAVSELSDASFDDPDPFRFIRYWCAKYWEKVAREAAEQGVLRSRP